MILGDLCYERYILLESSVGFLSGGASGAYLIFINKEEIYNENSSCFFF